MSRNKQRTAAATDAVAATAPTTPAAPASLSYVTPTEFVELPSRGKFYSTDHPLHNKEVIEMRYMTAKDEDILTSPALLKNGVAIDRLIENLIVDKNVSANSLLLGDKNAVILAARISGYGEQYEVNVNCPACGTTIEHSFDLMSSSVKNTNIIYEDALRINLAEVSKVKKVTLIANLPYNIATTLIISWIKYINFFETIIVMVQKEVADRLTAEKSNKSYSRLSVLIQLFCNIKKYFSF